MLAVRLAEDFLLPGCCELAVRVVETRCRCCELAVRVVETRFSQ